MSKPQLDVRQLAMLAGVFAHYPQITRIVLFGSRAKGTAKAASDIDLAVGGLHNSLEIEALADELDQLPVPFHFDVQALENIANPHLLAHIERVGLEIYRGRASQEP